MTRSVYGVVELDELERVVRIGLLYDHYGPLLTAHQREAIDLYYLQNWSLQEIAETWATSRQAVHDLVNRAVHLLESYERRLGLEVRERRNRDALKAVLTKLEETQTAVERNDHRARELLSEAHAAVASLLVPEEEPSEG